MNRFSQSPQSLSEPTLDPTMGAVHAVDHQAVDECGSVRAELPIGPVWRPVPAAVKQRLSPVMPETGAPLQRRLCGIQRTRSAVSDRKHPSTPLGMVNGFRHCLLEFLGI